MTSGNALGEPHMRKNPPFDAGALKQRAADEAGLTEFGVDDFEDYYLSYVDALNNDSVMTERGVEKTERDILKQLKNRLEVREWRAREPSIAEERIDRPIFLMGLPRSGTTFMHHLFDHDPNLRLPRMWETHRPCPPPAIDPQSAETRLRMARGFKSDVLSDIPNFDATHLLDPDGPDECTLILTQTFGMVGVLNTERVPRHYRWLFESADLRRMYAYQKSVLQLLQWKAPPRRWVLKYPNHIISMNELSSVFPDALFVISHRDPMQTLASLCSLTHLLRSMKYTEADNDKHVVGQEIWNFVQGHVDRLLEFRRSNSSVPFVDIPYNDLTADPAAVVGSVYDASGMTVPDVVRQKLDDWIRENPRGKRGVFSYRFEEYGLDREQVESGFEEYRRTFGFA